MLTLFHKSAHPTRLPQLRTLLVATLFAAPLLMPTPFVRQIAAQEAASPVNSTTIKRTRVEPNGTTTSTSSTFSTTQNYDGLLVVVRQQLKNKDNKVESYEAIEPAASLLTSLAKTPEQKGISLGLLAETLHRRQLYADSRTQWNKMLALPKSGDDDTDQTNQLMGRLGLVKSYLAQKDYTNVIAQYQALSDYVRTIKFDSVKDCTPQQIAGVFTLAQADAYYKMGRYEMALQQSDKAVMLNEGNSTFFGIALLQNGEMNLARRNYAASRARFNQMLGVSGAEKDKGFASDLATIAMSRLAKVEKLAATKAGGGKTSNALRGKSEPDKEDQDYASLFGAVIGRFPNALVNSFVLGDEDEE